MKNIICNRYSLFSAIFVTSIVGYLIYDNTLLDFFFKSKQTYSNSFTKKNLLHIESKEKILKSLQQTEVSQKSAKQFLQDIVECFLLISSSLSITELFEGVTVIMESVKATHPSILYEIDIDDLSFAHSKYHSNKDFDEPIHSLIGMPRMNDSDVSPMAYLSLENVRQVIEYILDWVSALLTSIQLKPPMQGCDVQLMLLVFYVIISIKLQEVYGISLSQLELSINRLSHSLENRISIDEMSFRFQQELSHFLELACFNIKKQ